jgi:ABC-2 type transport system ATP-binding protein
VTVLDVSGLRKEFDGLTALDGVSLSLEAGEVYGFLGPNGAGKSTAINIILDFMKPTAGRIRVFGMDPADNGVAVRRRTGTLLEGYGVYPRLTGREHLEHARDVKDVDAAIDPLLERVNIADAADRPAGDYSKGMTQRMAIAMAMLGDPDLLIFDEPTTGLDPNGARLVREWVAERAADGATVFFSSHLLEQVERVADRVGILVNGELIAEGDIDTLRQEVGLTERLTIEVTRVSGQLRDTLETIEGIGTVTEDDGHLVVPCADGRAKLRALQTVDQHGVYEDFGVESGSLDAVFSDITGGER